MNSPNILIFCVDQMASHCLGANGCRDARTPNLDRLAASGANAQRAYCPATVCVPSRASIITGLTPSATGITRNGQILDPSIPTLPAILADAGYRTHSVGKLHFQPYKADAEVSVESYTGWATNQIQCLPADYYGFQTADYMGGHGYYVHGDYVRWLHSRLDEPASWHKEGRLDDWFKPDAMRNLPPHLHYNHWVAERAIAFLKTSVTKADPFLLWCSFPDPHHPFVASRPYRERVEPSKLEISPTFADRQEELPILAEKRATQPDLSEKELREALAETHAMITHVDEQVGRVLDFLEASGQAETTMVVFLSDHGDYLGSHGLLRKSIWQYEELQRVPFLLRVPGAPAARWSTPVSLLDLVPTILDYAGLPSRSLAGRSLLPDLLKGTQPSSRPVLVEHQEDAETKARTIHVDHRKLIHYGRDGALAYDLKEDPYETHNLAGDKAFRAELDDLLISEIMRTSRNDRPRFATD